MKSIFVSLFIIFSTFVFSQKTTSEFSKISNKAKISGEIIGFKDGSQIWLGDRELGVIIKKAKAKNNKFTFENPSKFSPKKMYLIVREDTTNYWFNGFYVDNQNVFITVNKSDVDKDLKIKGSVSNDQSLVFDKLSEKLEKKYDSLNNAIGLKKQDTIKFKKAEIDRDRDSRSEVRNKIDQNKIEFIKSNPISYRALSELFWLKEKIGKEEVSKLYTNLDNNLKITDDGKNLKTYLELKKILQEGDIYEDFQAKDVKGKTHNLSDYIGKKYILLDFIQTYCYACVLSLEDLKKINEKYKEEVEIITFCGDKSEKTWKEGLKKHQTNWLSLWNGEGLFAKIPQLYGTDGTPTFILINPEGKIIKKQYGYEEGLLDKILEETIAKK